MHPIVETFFDPETSTASHVVACGETKRCAVIDTVMDYDPKSGRTDTKSADAVIAHILDQDYALDWILETHVHADHLSAAPYIQSKLGGKTGIGQRIDHVQSVFKRVFNAERTFATDGSQFDHLFADGTTFKIGSLTAEVLHTPGHTPACVTYVVGDAAFVGDTLFMPDFGTARCDFPGGDARQLYRSIQRVLALPDTTRLFMCHDYAPGGREVLTETSVADQKAHNIHVATGIDEDAFSDMRTRRDQQLGMPALILPSVQVNMRAGHFPPADENGIVYLKVPVNAL